MQAVSQLRQEVQGLDPELCGDAVVLPLYAALPPDQQVCSCVHFSMQLDQAAVASLQGPVIGQQAYHDRHSFYSPVPHITNKVFAHCSWCSSFPLGRYHLSCKDMNTVIIQSSKKLVNAVMKFRHWGLQVRVFSRPPEGCRRIVVATNIAETSVTVDGIVYVIDTGRVKMKSFNPQTGIDALGVIPISRCAVTSCTQF